MSSLTAALYGALIVYLGGWFLGHWTGNFSLLLFILTVVTLVYWLAERCASSPRARPQLRRSNSRTPPAAPNWRRWASTRSTATCRRPGRGC
jgi:hypothetical protein